MHGIVPTLSTKRLTLRPIVLDDFNSFAEFLASSRSEGMGGPYDRREAWGIFCHEVALWPLYGHGGLAAELLETGDCIGIVEINAGPLYPEPELGWQVYGEYEGNGFITEAACIYLDWAFTECKLNTLVSYIDPSNVRSIAVAERLGGVLDHLAAKQDPEDLVYRYTPEV
ncbi:MAG: GNAT family N-acetyltransferase [Rhodobacteraceae bacterium]|nr:GNAT family N-acetyltransferase [Paracoccaceae bacterium]